MSYPRAECQGDGWSDATPTGISVCKRHLVSTPQPSPNFKERAAGTRHHKSALLARRRNVGPAARGAAWRLPGLLWPGLPKT